MELKNMHIDDLIENYPCADDFFKIFGLELSPVHVELDLYLENLNENFFYDIGIEKKQLMEHFQYFIMSIERYNNKNKIFFS